MKNNIYDNKFNAVLNPYFLTGLTDAEACFSVAIKKDKRAKFGVNVGLEFTVKMLENETELLSMVESFFNCGKL